MLGLRLKSNEGASFLQIIIAVGPWLLTIIFFLNLFFFISSTMLTNSVVNRMALQVSSLGCVTTEIKDQLEQEGFGIENPEGGKIVPRIVFVSASSDGGFNEASVFGNGQLNADGNVPDCSNPAQKLAGNSNSKVKSGDYIVVYAQYRQRMLVFNGFNTSQTAVLMSNDLQGVSR